MIEIIFILSIITIIFSYYSLEAEDRLHSVVSLGMATISAGSIFLYVGAVYVAIYHFLVYSGVMTVLFAALAHFLPEDVEITAIENTTLDVTKEAA